MRPTDPWLRRQLAPARRQLLAVVAAGGLSSLLVIGQAWAVAGLVLAVLHDDALLVPSATVVLVLSLRGLVGWLGDLASASAAAVVGGSLRDQLVRTRVGHGDSTSTGAFSVLATRGVSAAEPYLTRYLPAFLLAMLLPPLTVVAMATQDLLSAVIVLATVPLVPVFGALVGLATRDRAREQWRELSSLSGHFVDVVRGLPTLVAHRRARIQSSRIAAITDRYRVASLRTLRIAFASSLVLELVATLSVALVAVTTGVRLAGGSMGLHTALVVLLLAPEAYWPLRRVGAEFHASAEGVATFEAARAVLDPDVEQAPGGRRSELAPAPAGAPLLLRGVTITHAGRVRPAVDGLDAVIPAHGVTVLTGPSGSGKSTLLDGLAGLLPLAVGSITADGHPVGGPAWQARVARLPQRPYFIAGSVADNLRLGRPDASEDTLWNALRQVALEVRVRALPQGLDSPLGEDGSSLSAGERARLALARVLVADRPWVLLDEPTAHLDELTERVIADTIVELGRTSAVVVVAHRPALVDLADHRIELPDPAPPAPQPVRRSRLGTAAADPRPAGVTLPEPRFAGSTVLSALASASGVALTATAGWLIVQASTRPAVLTMLVAIVGVRTFGLARPVLRYAERLRSHDAALRLLARRRVEVYDALVPLTPARLGLRRGDVLASVVDDVDSVVDRELRVRMPLRSFVLVALIAAAVAALLLPAAVLVVAASLTAGLGAAAASRAGALHAERRTVTTRAELSTYVVEVAQMSDELRMWQAADTAAARVRSLSDRLGWAARAAAAWAGAGRALVLAVAGLGMALAAALAAPRVADGSLSGPLMALLVLLPLALADVTLPLAESGAVAARTAAAADRLDRLEALEPAVRDTGTAAVTVRHDVELVRARARWDDDSPLTAACSLRLESGDRVALVGPSGSGKSTVAALLLRFLDPVEGAVRLGDTALDAVTLDDVRRLVGLVDDDPHVFATSVLENIRLARPGATADEVEEALRSARLGPWLDGLPDGLDTLVGDGHGDVSGGERARLAVARSLLADQPVLVLDEPAAHLDHATGTRLAEELLTGPRARTVLWITHADIGLDLVDHVVQLGEQPGYAPASAGRDPALEGG